MDFQPTCSYYAQWIAEQAARVLPRQQIASAALEVCLRTVGLQIVALFAE